MFSPKIIIMIIITIVIIIINPEQVTRVHVYPACATANANPKFLRL